MYPHAPLVLVVVEVRHPAAEPLTSAQRLTIKQDLGGQLPILKSGQLTTVQATLGATAGSEVRTEEFPRYVSRDNTTVASVRSESLVVETTRYNGWEDLRELVTCALRARQEVNGVDGVERIGLRYINEIRVPGDTEENWSPWLDAALVGSVLSGEQIGLRAVQWQGITVYASAPDQTVTLRHGARDGYAVEPGGVLKRPIPAPGPFFLIDIDSYWTPSEGTPEFDVDRILASCDELHGPVRSLFEGLITDRLRQEVLCCVE